MHYCHLFHAPANNRENMKVILLKRVKGLGEVAQEVNVKPGYGRNFLIPQNVAVRSTAENQEVIKARKAELEEQNKEAIKLAKEASLKIAGKDITYIKQSADDGRLFGSVSAKEIAKEVQTLCGVEISHSSILLNNPIKSIGIYEVSISIHADVTCNILVNIARSESQANDAIKEYKSAAEKESKTSDEDAA